MNETSDIPAAPPRVYAIDAYGLIFQMFHGMPQMNAPDGRPTNAVFGVTRALMSLYELGAEYLVAAFDTPEPTFRSDIDAEYKSHRPPMPEDLLAQEPLIRSVLEAMGVPVLTCPGFEADDILAAIAHHGGERGYQVFLCTSDKDCRQLLNDRVKIMNLRKGEILDADGLLRDWGIRPDQVADYQALVGDSVDNVPGVPGCGAKTATKWLQQYGTLDNIIAHADELGGPKLKASFKEAVTNGKLEEGRKLVRLRIDTPIELAWDNWKRRDWEGQKLLELFQEFGFRGFAAKVRTVMSKGGAEKNAALLGVIADATPTPPRRKPKGESNLFDTIYETESDNPFDAPADDWSYAGYKLVDNHADFQMFLKELQSQKRFVFDLETTSLDTHAAEIVGIAIAWQPGEAYYLALRGPAGEPVLDPVKTLDTMRPIFENPKIGKANQNIKYDLLVLKSHGVTVNGVDGDSMIAHYLLHSTEAAHGLDELTRRFLNHENISITTLIGKGKKQLTMDAVPTEKVKNYAAEDADTALRLTAMFEEQLNDQKLVPLYRETELPLLQVLTTMEHRGIRIDVPYLAKLSVEMAEQLVRLEEGIHELAGRKFNIASPKQLREILFGEMGLPVQKKTGITGEPSTDQESLELLAALGHQLPTAIIEHRQVAKLKGTYVDALPTLVNPKTGRIHSSFNQTIAATGRLSSSDPNLQNIPARTEQGKQIRKAFLPQEGWTLLTADYSQIELRLLAHFSGDEAMRDAFGHDADIHARVAAEIFKIPEVEVSKAQRGMAKTVNFGVIYGMSAHGLSTRLNIPRQEAEEFIDAYFDRYPKILAYQDGLLAKARKQGFVATILGRKRPFDPNAIRPHTSYRQRNQAEREAINMEIQGSAADLMKKAMLYVQARLEKENLETAMLLSVHDELVFEVPPGELPTAVQLVREEMVNAMMLSVPLKVDVATGPNWLEVEDA